MNCPFDKSSSRWIVHSMNHPVDEPSIRWMCLLRKNVLCLCVKGKWERETERALFGQSGNVPIPNPSNELAKKYCLNGSSEHWSKKLTLLSTFYAYFCSLVQVKAKKVRSRIWTDDHSAMKQLSKPLHHCHHCHHCHHTTTVTTSTILPLSPLPPLPMLWGAKKEQRHWKLR